VDQIAAAEGLPVAAKLPIDPSLTAACDSGRIEYIDVAMMDGLGEILPPIE